MPVLPVMRNISGEAIDGKPPPFVLVALAAGRELGCTAAFPLILFPR